MKKLLSVTIKAIRTSGYQGEGYQDNRISGENASLRFTPDTLII
jgi:hypothetical protein